MGVKVPDSKSILPFPYLSVRVFAIDFSFSSKEDNLFFNKISCSSNLIFEIVKVPNSTDNWVIWFFKFNR